MTNNYIFQGGVDGSPPQKQFQPRETLVFIRLVRWGLQSLDIYTLQTHAPNTYATPRSPVSLVRSKEEKEVLEHFSGVVSDVFNFFFMCISINND